MKQATLAVLCAIFVFPWLGAGQNVYRLLSDTPECAVPCIFESLREGNCSLTAFSKIPECACTNTTLLRGLSDCVQDKCTFADQKVAVVVLDDLCLEYPKESRTNQVAAWAISSTALTVLFTVLRCLSRYIATGGLWWDDWLIIAAAASLIALCSIQIAASRVALGFHYWNIDPDNAESAFKLFYSAQLMYIVVQVTSKVAILLLFWRIFVDKQFRRLVWAGVAFLVAHGLVFLFLIIFQCDPIRSVWDKTVPATCLGLKAISAVGAALAIVEDVVILALPIRQVLKLQVNLRKKIAISFMFSIGSFACVTSMVRLKYVVTYQYTGDYTWHNVDFFIWCMIELAAAVICGCLPALRPLMKKITGSVSSVRDYLYPRSTGTDSSWVSGSQGDFDKIPEPPRTPHVAKAPATPPTHIASCWAGGNQGLEFKELPRLPSAAVPPPPRTLSVQSDTPTSLLETATTPPRSPTSRPSSVHPRSSASLRSETSLYSPRPPLSPTSVPLPMSPCSPTLPGSPTLGRSPTLHSRSSRSPSPPLQVPASLSLPKRGSRPIDWFADLPSPVEESRPIRMSILETNPARLSLREDRRASRDSRM